MAHPLPAAPPAAVPGTVTISDEALAQVVGLTVLECYGVVGMAARNLTQGVARLLSRDRLTQGIAVQRTGDALAIDLYVVLEYGLNLKEVGQNLRSRVTYTVEKLTRLRVESIEVWIQGVRRT
jgi:uncharacterized alkaline shock family protein YloU